MTFNSVDFLIFLPLVFGLFYALKGVARKWLLLLASCVFYMWFIPAYLPVLFVTITIDYVAAMRIEDAKTARARKMHLLFAIINTCLVLFIFKYHNFFVGTLASMGLKGFGRWDLLLPIGLSFHTFQSLSYVIEVYRGNLKTERNLLVYSNFVMMFPQLVAGPIERASNLLPQIRAMDHQARYEDFSVGLTRFAWGLFKKVAIADLLAIYVDAAYDNYTHQPGSVLLVATFFFALQIYCDFSGYSDMAIGVARMFGFQFRENFRLPYFSGSVTEFWRRWHISLSTWWRDYVYIPLGGSRESVARMYRNLFLTFLIAGLWHGASWNFIVWGALNGLYLAFEKWTGFPLSTGPNRILNPFLGAVRALYVFFLLSFSWVFFRAETLTQATGIMGKIVEGFAPSRFQFLNTTLFASILLGAALMLAFEYFVLRKVSFDDLYRRRYGDTITAGLTVFLFGYAVLFGNSAGGQFIYFQF